MTKTKKVLSCLIEGGKTYSDIRDEVGLSETDLRRVIGYLQKRGYIETIPLSYELTQYGKARHEYKPKSSPKKIAQVAARNKRVRESRSATYSMGPNSVFQLGAMQ